MTLEEAIKMVKMRNSALGGYRNVGMEYFYWNGTSDYIVLDGDFSSNELEALSIIMRAYKGIKINFDDNK